MITKGTILIAAPVHPVLTDGLKAAGYELIIEEHITQAKGLKLIHDCIGVITSTRLQLNKEMIDAATGLCFIGRMGSGMEVINMEYARQQRIDCYFSPEGNSNAVAEHALGMLLSLNKHIAWSYDQVKEGKWLREENRGVELEGKTVGIIGYGHTGISFAKKLQGFDVKILAYDKYKVFDSSSQVAYCSNIDAIYREADIISFHVPIQKDTRHYLNETFTKEMHKPFVLINTSRGEVVDSDALVKGIRSGKIRGACLDVWEEEPLPKMSIKQREIINELITLPNVIITPHIAGYTYEALFKMSAILLDKIVK